MSSYTPAGNKDFNINYRFIHAESDVNEINVILDHKTLLSHVNTPPEQWPEWTRTDFYPCNHCQSACHHTYCPIAVRLIEPISLFSKRISYEPVIVEVLTNDRFYRKEVDMQQGLSSLFGLLMATSGCPSMSVFRPMARYHLPFASFEETFFRIYGSYLMQQHLNGAFPQNRQVLVEGMNEVYRKVAEVNNGVMERMRKAHAHLADSSPNAVALLAAFSGLVPLTVSQQLDYLSRLFKG